MHTRQDSDPKHDRQMADSSQSGHSPVPSHLGQGVGTPGKSTPDLVTAASRQSGQLHLGMFSTPFDLVDGEL